VPLPQSNFKISKDTVFIFSFKTGIVVRQNLLILLLLVLFTVSPAFAIHKVFFPFIFTAENIGGNCVIMLHFADICWSISSKEALHLQHDVQQFHRLSSVVVEKPKVFLLYNFSQFPSIILTTFVSNFYTIVKRHRHPGSQSSSMTKIFFVFNIFLSLKTAIMTCHANGVSFPIMEEYQSNTNP